MVWSVLPKSYQQPLDGHSADLALAMVECCINDPFQRLVYVTGTIDRTSKEQVPGPIVGLAQKVLASGGLPLFVPPSQFDSAVEVASKMWSHKVGFSDHITGAVLNEKTLAHTRAVIFQEKDKLGPSSCIHFVSRDNWKTQAMGWACANRAGFLPSDAHGLLAVGKKDPLNGDCPLLWDGNHADYLCGICL